MKAFLSIDLDYWGDHIEKYDSCPSFLDKVYALEVPIKYMHHHQRILRYLNRTEKFDKIYNIDYHSDIAFEPVPFLNEGTWANFYQYKQDTIFEWRYPNKNQCYTRGYGICDLTKSYKWRFNEMGYSKAVHKRGLDDIEWDSITAVGICFSKEWWYKRDMTDIITEYKMDMDNVL